MSIYAIADLHLSFSENKPMDIFGEKWKDHEEKIKKDWIEKVTDDEMCNYIESLGYRKPYMGGYYDLKLEFIPRGTLFCIHEYDGAESIETPETMCMMIV